MVTVVKGRNFGSRLGEALGTLGGSYVGSKIQQGRQEEAANRKFQQEREQEKEKLSDVLQRYEEFKTDPRYQNMPLEEKMTMASILFGKDVGAQIGKAAEIEGKGIEGKGKEIKPALTLNEELNQLQKRTKSRVDDLSRPYVKQDAFGNIMIDFEQDDKKRSAVLAKISKELQKEAGVAERIYRQYGQPVPQDIEERLKETIFVDMDGFRVPMTVVEDLEEFEQSRPAVKNKGKQARDEEKGIVYESDGKSWKIVAVEGEQ